MAVILGHFAPIHPSYFVLVVNLIFLALAWVVLGRGFALKTLSGSVLFPICIHLTAGVSPLVREHLLGALVGGAVMGLGIGLVFRGKSTVGGFSTLSIILHRKRGIMVDRSLLFFDATVLVAALAFMPAEAALSAIVCSYVLSKTARATLTGPSTAQMAWVVSDRAQVLREHILHSVDLGVTVVPAQGGYTGKAKELLLVVMQPSDVPRFKTAVRDLDPAAFVVLAEAGEVLGYGFAPHH